MVRFLSRAGRAAAGHDGAGGLARRFGRRLGRMLGAGAAPGAEAEGLVDLRGLLDDPLEAGQRAGERPFLLTLPLARMRDLPPLCPSWAANPFLLTARAHLAGRLGSYEGSPLHAFFEAVQPASAAEALGLAGGPLARMPAAEAAMPWGLSGPGMRRARIATAAKHAREYGRDIPGEEGHYAMGPVSPRKGAFELERLCRTLDSIRATGYRPPAPESNIRGFLLERGGDWAFMVLSGTHRVPALLALGRAEVDAIVVPGSRVRRDEAERWPSVAAGLLTAEEARGVFDRVFDGRDLPWLAARWPAAGGRDPGEAGHARPAA